MPSLIVQVGQSYGRGYKALLVPLLIQMELPHERVVTPVDLIVWCGSGVCSALGSPVSAGTVVPCWFSLTQGRLPCCFD